MAGPALRSNAAGDRRARPRAGCRRRPRGGEPRLVGLRKAPSDDRPRSLLLAGLRLERAVQHGDVAPGDRPGARAWRRAAGRAAAATRAPGPAAAAPRWPAASGRCRPPGRVAGGRAAHGRRAPAGSARTTPAKPGSPWRCSRAIARCTMTRRSCVRGISASATAAVSFQSGGTAGSIVLPYWTSGLPCAARSSAPKSGSSSRFSPAGASSETGGKPSHVQRGHVSRGAEHRAARARATAIAIASLRQITGHYFSQTGSRVQGNLLRRRAAKLLQHGRGERVGRRPQLERGAAFAVASSVSVARSAPGGRELAARRTSGTAPMAPVPAAPGCPARRRPAQLDRARLAAAAR